MFILNTILKDVRINTLKISGITKTEKILDICCGDGDQLFYFAQEGINCVGIDINEKAIKSAEKKRKKYKFHNIFFQVADAEKLPFENDLFDCVLISLGLHENNKEKIDKIVSEAKRVTKQDGCLIFVDFTSPLPKNFVSFLIKTIEYFVGKENLENFNNYLKRGGLNSILRRNNLRQGKRIVLKSGNITIIKAGK
jgi:ubiquinone/menaquinone biosynthesis C-methylase UbiE